MVIEALREQVKRVADLSEDISHARQREEWLSKLLARRPLNVAVVELANKMAPTIWALLAHDRIY